MAMTQSGMSAVIFAALESAYGIPPDPTKLQQFADSLAGALVNYIKTNAVITTSASIVDAPVKSSGGSPTGDVVSITVNSTGTIS